MGVLIALILVTSVTGGERLFNDVRTFESDYRYNCSKFDSQLDNDLAYCGLCERIRPGSLYAFSYKFGYLSMGSFRWETAQHTKDECWFEHFKNNECNHFVTEDSYGNRLTCHLETGNKPLKSCSSCDQTSNRVYRYKLDKFKYGIHVARQLFKSEDECLQSKKSECE